MLNARDALPSGGQISIETGNCRMQVLSSSGGVGSENPCLPCAPFAVEDNGVGMDKSIRAHLFEPFFTTKAGKGMGIGLATVPDIVSSNGGLIHVETEVGHGTRISILLPILPQSTPECSDPTSSHHKPSGALLSFQSEETTP